MTEHEYEEWFDKYLGDVESLDKPHLKSPIQNTPRPFKKSRWLVIHIFSLLMCLIISFMCALIYTHSETWIVNWLSNAFLNLSIGLVASLFIFIYTNHRDRNIAFYTDVIPMLKSRYENMHKAYFDFTFKISIFHQVNDYENCYAAWNANSNTCFVIIDFFEYLLKVLPFKPNCIGNLSFERLELYKGNILEIHRRVQKEFFETNMFSKELSQECQNVTYIGFQLLQVMQSLIEEFEQELYKTKYGNKFITEAEKIDDEYERQRAKSQNED